MITAEMTEKANQHTERAKKAQARYHELLAQYKGTRKLLEEAREEYIAETGAAREALNGGIVFDYEIECGILR